jgi:hypothetical protein
MKMSDPFQQMGNPRFILSVITWLTFVLLLIVACGDGCVQPAEFWFRHFHHLHVGVRVDFCDYNNAAVFSPKINIGSPSVGRVHDAIRLTIEDRGVFHPVRL